MKRIRKTVSFILVIALLFGVLSGSFPAMAIDGGDPSGGPAAGVEEPVGEPAGETEDEPGVTPGDAPGIEEPEAAAAAQAPEVLSSTLYAVLERWHSHYLYQDEEVAGASKENLLEDKRAWWYLEETSGGYMLKNYQTGDYVTTKSSEEYFECLPLDTEALDSYLFTKTASGTYTLFRNKASGFLINMENSLGYAENAALDGVDTNAWSAQFTLVPLSDGRFMPVTGLTMDTTAVVGVDKFLSAAVIPVTATCKDVVWSIQDPGTTGAQLIGTAGSALSTTAAGTVLLRATIVDGAGTEEEREDFVKDFEIVVTEREVFTVQSGALKMVAGITGTEGNKGLELLSIYDMTNSVEMLSSTRKTPFFAITAPAGKGISGVATATLNASAKWTSITHTEEGGVHSFVFAGHADEPDMTVTVTADTTQAGKINWGISVDNASETRTIQYVRFPQISVRKLASDGKIFVPHYAGEIYDYWTTGGSMAATYPSCTVTMPFMAAYGGGTGLYMGRHDPNVDIVVPTAAGQTASAAVDMSFRIDAPDYTKAGNDYNRPDGKTMFALTEDWYSAAMLYRDWVSNKAPWWPKIDENGRKDTPQWFKELNVWTKSENWYLNNEKTELYPADSTTEDVKAFQEYMGMPVGNHWYRWHDCLMDGDFPEYFPPVEDFLENVLDQQAHDIYVMPYVNGRLWEAQIDSFTEEGGYEAASKDINGNLYTGAFDVPTGKLATMCPSTQTWQDKVAEFTNTLFGDYGVYGVYQDMVAYSAPDRCFDESHGHTLFGGDYWQKGYQEMYLAIRAAMPEGTILATEGPADAYANLFDAELAYVMSNSGLEGVPALHAVLANATQLMGRYMSKSESFISWKQKNGRAFVWGEQLGWADPDILPSVSSSYAGKAAYLKDTAKVRSQINRAIYAGQMGRPLTLGGNSTVVGSDITTLAVENGVWMLPQDGKVVVLFTNISDTEKTVSVNMDLSDYGITGNVEVSELGPDGKRGGFTSGNSISRELTLSGSEARAWEITPNSKTVLVLMANPGDEALTAAGVIDSNLSQGNTVKVAFVTNNDTTEALGQQRLLAAIEAGEYIGLDEDDIIFLGYGAGTLSNICKAPDAGTVVTSAAGKSATYALPDKQDYHTQAYDEPAAYSRSSVLSDITDLIDKYRPDDIYTNAFDDQRGDRGTNIPDVDRSATAWLVTEALVAYKKANPDYSPVLHEAFIVTKTGVWPTVLPADPGTELPGLDLTAYAEFPSTFIRGPRYEWARRESISVPNSMKEEDTEKNRKYQMISRYIDSTASTFYYKANFMKGFVKADEVFWTHDFSNIAITAEITASSQMTQYAQTVGKLADGIADGYNSSNNTNSAVPSATDRGRIFEWSSVGTGTSTVGQWVKLSWTEPQQINKIVLWDRRPDSARIKSSFLEFSDESRIDLGEFRTNGYANEINFGEKTVTWVKLTTVTTAGTSQAGLTEFEVFPVREDKNAAYNEADKYESYATVAKDTAVGADVTSAVAKLKSGTVADGSVAVSYSVSPGTYLRVENGRLYLGDQKATKGDATERVTITFEKDGVTARKEVQVTVKSSYVLVVMIKDYYRKKFFYETTELVDDKAVVGVATGLSYSEKSAWWIVKENDDGTVMLKNYLSGNYITNINGEAYYEVLSLPADEAELNHYTFRTAGATYGTLFYNVASGNLLHNETESAVYAETDDKGTNTAAWSAHLVLTEVGQPGEGLRIEAALYENIATIPSSLAAGTDVTNLVVRTIGETDPGVEVELSVEPGTYLEVDGGAVKLKARKTTEGVGVETVTLTLRNGDGESYKKHISVAVQTGYAGTAGPERLLIFSPHPDDDVLGTSGVIYQAIRDGKEVYVAYVTSGDYYGYDRAMTRIGELCDALELLGVDPEESVIIMGYGDSALTGLYGSESLSAVTEARSGESKTYGSAEYPDYHTTRFGSSAPYCKGSIYQDFETILNELRPDEVYTTSIYDTHADHKAAGLFVTDSLVMLKKLDPTYSPRLLTTIVHEDDSLWPVRQEPQEDMRPFSKPVSLDTKTPLNWEKRISVPVPEVMMTLPVANNLKYQAIEAHVSQKHPYNRAFVKSDEFFWATDFSNIAYFASITASSQATASSQLAGKVADGIFDGSSRFPAREWSSSKEKAGAWIELRWDREYTIDRINLYDRVNLNDNILAATLTFSDGTSVVVGELPANGWVKEIMFDPKTVSWVRLTVDEVGASTSNVGLSEMEVFLADEPKGTAPEISAATLADGVVGKAYSHTLEAEGSVPMAWSLATGRLPEGLALSGEGVISGTPASVGTFVFTVQAGNGYGTDTAQLTLRIAAADVPTGGDPDSASSGQQETVISGGTAILRATAVVTGGSATAMLSQSRIADAVNKAKAASATAGEAASVQIDLTVPAGAGEVNLVVPRAAVQSLAAGGLGSLTVSAAMASVAFDGAVLDALAGASDGDLTLTLAQVDAGALSAEVKKAVGDRPVYEFAIMSGGKAISQLGGTAKVSIPYTPAAGEEHNAIVIYYINGEGAVSTLTGGHYDSGTGCVVFTTQHFSQYAVGYRPVSFGDVAKQAWYYGAVSFIAARGITDGKGAGSFGPDAELTRGEFLVMLMRACEIKPDSDPSDNFSDGGDTFYTGYLAAAKRLGIAGGIGDNRFGPDRSITRQEMFTLLFNALKVLDRLPRETGGKGLADFSDASEFDSWAREASERLLRADCIGGRDGLLTPRGTATRAEMAQLLYNLLMR